VTSIGHLDIALGSSSFWFEAVRRMYGIEIINSSKTPLLAAWAERFGGSAEAKEVVVPEAGEAVRYAHKLHAAAAAKVNWFGTSDWAMHHVRKETNKDIG
jgi:glutathione S-transferase